MTENTIPLDPNAPDDPGDSISVAEYRKRQRESKAELAFETQLRHVFMDEDWTLDAILREYQFAPPRKWRSDFAIPYGFFRGEYAPLQDPDDADDILLIEIEGGTRQYGRHNRHDGFTNDAIKYSAASALGFTILRGTSQMVYDGLLIEMVRQVLTGDLNIRDWKAT